MTHFVLLHVLEPYALAVIYSGLISHNECDSVLYDMSEQVSVQSIVRNQHPIKVHSMEGGHG